MVFFEVETKSGRSNFICVTANSIWLLSSSRLAKHRPFTHSLHTLPAVSVAVTQLFTLNYRNLVVTSQRLGLYGAAKEAWLIVWCYGEQL